MIYKGHPKRHIILTAIQIVIGLLIILIGALAFLDISNTLKWILIIVAVALAGYPLGKYLYKKYFKKETFEERRGRKLK